MSTISMQVGGCLVVESISALASLVGRGSGAVKLITCVICTKGAIFIISAVGVVVSLTETLRNMRNLRDMVKITGTVNRILLEEETEEATTVKREIPLHELLPGDIIDVSTPGLQLPCDCVLMEGTCIVNESMLTGKHRVARASLRDVRIGLSYS